MSKIDLSNGYEIGWWGGLMRVRLQDGTEGAGKTEQDALQDALRKVKERQGK